MQRLAHRAAADLELLGQSPADVISRRVPPLALAAKMRSAKGKRHQPTLADLARTGGA
jgi:hypothetical protein